MGEKYVDVTETMEHVTSGKVILFFSEMVGEDAGEIPGAGDVHEERLSRISG